MSSDNTLLRQIPKVDELLRHPALACHGGESSPPDVAEAVRTVLDGLRTDILTGALREPPDNENLVAQIKVRIETGRRRSLRRVINGTGTILHTNLGRAPLASEALEAISQAAKDYSTLEYNVEKGERGSRHSHVEALLTRLTGAEAAMVVNNNAAAVMLILSAMGSGREVIVSRGELVEIGGSFRVPDVMAQSGCRLVEVGTTNKTHPNDYELAIDPEQTGALMKVHTSNFKIVGFTESVSLESLVEIGRRHGLPVIEDLGSGCFLPLAPYGILNEPVVADSVAAGADAVSFSGDKLLGGPQAGIVVGRADLVAKMKRHPLARALRIDKLTLAALEATLRLYLDPGTVAEKIPVLRMLTTDIEALDAKAARLFALLEGRAAACAEVMRESSQVGGGSVPGQALPTAAVVLSPAGISEDELERRLRLTEPAIVGRIARERLILDVRTLDEADFPLIAERLNTILGGEDTK